MAPSKSALWIGRVLSALPSLLLVFSASMKITLNPQVVEGVAKMGISTETARGIGIVELVCTVLYVVPPTAALGAILLTGYLGGAVMVHVQAGDSYVMPIVIGVLLWLGLVLRVPAYRVILPGMKSGK